VIVPRSYLGELLFSDLIGGEGLSIVEDPDAVSSVLDLCTGSGCLAILAAEVFASASVDAVDLSADALAVAAINVADYGLQDRVNLHEGDLFAPLKGRRFDLILSNPPYVDADGMTDLPPEYAAEPAMALDGGPDGLDLVRRIVAQAPDHLTENGGLLVELGRCRPAFETAFPDLDVLWLDSAESEGEVFFVTRAQLTSAKPKRRR
jgi:ribosomal protein L3 glutamine methyltransferase